MRVGFSSKGVLPPPTFPRCTRGQYAHRVPELPEKLDTERLLDIYADLEPQQDLGATPVGVRSIFVIRGGTFEGEKLRGVVHPGGADWFVLRPNGAGELDVRLTLETDDGALIYMTYTGVLDLPPEIARRVFANEDVSPAEYYFRTQPRFETGSEKYGWLNKLVCIGSGIAAPGRVAYRIFAVK